MSRKFCYNIDNYVSRITENYEVNSDIISFNLTSMPNREAIIEITNMIKEVLFPGYFGKQNPYPWTIKYRTGELLDMIFVELQKQISMAFKTQEATMKEKLSQEEIEYEAEKIICCLFEKLPEIRDFLVTDIQAAFEGDPAASDTNEIIFSYPGISAIITFRVAHELFKMNTPLIPRIMTEYAHSDTGVDIHPGAEIGKYFFIDHGTGVVIGETTKIGEHVKIYQGVTLGALSTRAGQGLRNVKRHPTLEDNVVVYSGASILGGETVIGEDVVIGSNVFITSSVPAHMKVSLKSPELIYKEATKPQDGKEF